MKVRALLTLLASLLLLIPAGAAAAVDLHAPHQGTTVQCDGDLLWHFVHNQVDSSDATVGQLTATFSGAGAVVVDAYKVLRSVRHYEVITSGGDTLMSASDNITGGKLVLSHTECMPGTPPPPPPGDECVAGDTVAVSWGGVELGNPEQWMLFETSSSPVSLLPGTYSVSLTSGDPDHMAGFQMNQTQEQWYVELYSGGMSVATTGTIADLPDASTELTQVVGNITLADGADTAVATHKLAGTTFPSPESVHPVTAVFTCL